jgi:predicted nucleic acid-binding protein
LFANRFTALVDACTLTNTLKRNLLLTLAEAGFFRLRWSGQILDETEAAIEKVLREKGRTDPRLRAKRARTAMETAFEDAMVSDFDRFMSAADGLPDPNDAHVVAAAIKTRASMIVTENLKHFPAANLATINMEAKSADEFIADTIALDEGRAVAAIREMRERFNKPAITAEALLLKMEAEGMQEAVDLLRPYIESL